MARFMLVAALALIKTSAAVCDRAFLEKAAERYVNAQINGRSEDISSFMVDSASYSENDLSVGVNKGTLTQAIAVDTHRSIYDTEQCATWTELIAEHNAGHPYVIGTRIVYNGEREKITAVESIVTDEGDWLFNATGYAYWNALETWDPIPEAKRDTRAVVKAAGDAYFDRFDRVNVTVPFGNPCSRLEGGDSTARLMNMTGGGDSCTAAGMPQGIVVTNRRYVVDEVMGVVSLFVGFPGLDRSVGQQPAPDSHTFRVESGKIRYVHTVSACVNKGCGLTPDTPPLVQPPSRRRSIRGLRPSRMSLKY
ncbi:hypothetical protein PG985_003163 [Apiospora marii]|uniref:uncharacterized protein n=1 Tax=Apiospora marii TaxID=335849 RepID=UPI0031308FC0